MAVRKFDFTVGPEQSAPPTVSDPSGPDDLISQGYADARYVQGSESVANNAGITAIAEAERRDGDIVLARDSSKLYRFDIASAASADGDFVLAPDSGSGRWLRITILNKANTFTNTTSSTTKDTGAMILEGGLGVEENINLGGNLGVDGNATVTGDLTVNGTTTTVNTDTLDVEDANITVNKGGDQATANINIAGLTVEMSDATDAKIGYDSSLASKYKAGESGSESEILTASTAQTATGLKTFDPGIQVDTLSATPANASTDKIKIYAKDDGKVYKIDDAGNEVELGAGASGSGEVNFIDNFDAESGATTGWATYADAAGTEPVDGTGGSPTVGFTAQSSVILRGAVSFRLSKPASNAQGMGVSYDFAIGEQDRGRKCKIQFDFKSNEDAGFTQGYLKVFIYDVDNSTLITPVDTDIPDTAGIFQTSWNSTQSTNYRLIFHVATADAASGWDVYFDNVIVGPGQVSQGAAIGAGVTATPSWIGLTVGNASVNTLTYYRSGDRMKVQAYIRLGSTSSVTFNIQLNIPNSLTIDTSKVGEFQLVGQAWGLDDATSARYNGSIFRDGSATSVSISAENGSTNNWNATTPNTWATGDRIYLDFEVPILEWAGQGIVPMLAEDNLSEWQDFTPGSFINSPPSTTLTLKQASYRRSGDLVKCRLRYIVNVFDYAGSPQAANVVAIDNLLPAGLTIDSGYKDENRNGFGFVNGFFSGTGNIVGYSSGYIEWNSTLNGYRFFINNVDNATTGSSISNLNWAAFGSPSQANSNGGFLTIEFEVPIVEWAGSQNSLVGYSLASETQTGLVSTGEQTFAGEKHFTGDVGIGTTNPGVRLEVQEPSGTTKSHVTNATDDGMVEIESVPGIGGYVNLFDNTNAQTVKFRSNGVSYFNSGNVGIGETSPEAKIHVSNNINQDVTAATSGVNRILLKDTSNFTFAGRGFAIDAEGVYGVLGRIAIGKSNSAVSGSFRDFGTISFLTHSNASPPGDDYSALQEIMTIRDDRVGVKTTSPATSLEVFDDGNTAVGVFQARNSNTGAANPAARFFTANTGTSTANKIINFIIGAGVSSGAIGANGANAAAFTTYSDRRLKENIVSLSDELKNILALNPVSFDFKQGGSNVGFIAQELEKVYPDAVSYVGEETEEMKQVGGWDKTTARLVKAIQEQQAIIEKLQARIEALEAKCK